MFRSPLIALVVAGTLLAGCTAANNRGQNEVVGTVLGAAGGGLLGNQFGGGTGKTIATAAGTLLGAWLGNSVGQSLDTVDRGNIQRAESTAYVAPVGQQITWNNPQSGNYGTITPVREGTNNTNGQLCREFRQTIVVGGQTQEGYGTACRQVDGSWKIVQ